MTLGARLHDGLLEHTPLRDRALRKRLVHVRRRGFEALGSRRYSRPAAGDLDAQLQCYLPATGTFVEAGANDGYTWSNTYYLERWRGWTGVLVEPIPSLAEECRALRTRSRVLNCALVPVGFPAATVTMTSSDLRSLIRDSEPTFEAEIVWRGENAGSIEVPARTLTEVLADAGLGRPDFISLDLEGYEANALRGLDLITHGPTWLLVETLGGEGRAGVESVLGDAYGPEAELTTADILYRRRA